MSAEEAQARRARTGTPETAGAAEENLLELAADWTAAAGSRFKATAELALAETRLAALSVTLMLMLAIVAGGFVLAAWGLLMAGVVTGLLALGVPLWSALAGLAALHVLCAGLLLWRMTRLSVHLELPATRRQFGGGDSREQPDGVA